MLRTLSLVSMLGSCACASVREEERLRREIEELMDRSEAHQHDRRSLRHRRARWDWEVDTDEPRPGTSFCAPGDGWKAEWADEFNGDKLNTQVWEAITTHMKETSESGVSAPVAGLGVTACRSAKCRPGNVRVHDGQLHLISERNADNQYFTGAITTKGHKAWKDDKPYRLCVSAKLPGGGGLGKGIWPAHWMLPDNGKSDQCLDEGEMDILEMINGDGGAYSTYHWMSSWPQQQCASFDLYHKSQARQFHMPSDWSEAFHEYAVERSADTIRFAIDGEVVNTVDANDLGIQLSHSPFFLILNTAVGGGWPGEPDGLTHMPTEHVIDYVRVSRKVNNTAEPISTGSAAPSFIEISESVNTEFSERVKSPPPMSRM